MAEFPALPLWTDAYLGDTTHLTTIEHGAYLLLLMVAWRTKDTRLPDDDRLLARYARATPGQWRRLRPILEPFFRIENGYWVQGRLTDEALAVRQRRESAAANGRASALKRLGRHSTKRIARDEQSESKATNEASTTISKPIVDIAPTALVELPSDASEPGVPDNQAGEQAEQDSDYKITPREVVDSWNVIAARMGKPQVRDMTPARITAIKCRIAQNSLDDFGTVFSNFETSSFLGKKKAIGFDWLMKRENFQKTLEGNYND